MISLSIDGKQLQVGEGTTLLDAATRLGLEIPALCHLAGEEPYVSCMVCLVEERGSGRLLPACATRAEEGMDILSASDEVMTARRQALELLLSEHIGDCEGPCRHICPAHMDIPTMLRQIEQGDLHGALVTVKREIALPALLGRICPAPCEKGCRRRDIDSSIAICRLKGMVAEVDLASGSPYRPACRPASGKRVAIVGAGPAGLAAAYHLLQAGHACTIIDALPEPGGPLRGGIAEEILPLQLLDAEIATIIDLGAELRMVTRVGVDLSMDELRSDFDAVVLAPGDLDSDAPQMLGVEVAKGRVKVDGTTFATSLPGVFAGGGAVRPGRLAVRAVAHGHAMAVSVDQYLRGVPVSGLRRRLASKLGKLRPGELQQILQWSNELRPPDLARELRPGIPGESFTADHAAREAARCLRCSCLDAEGCDLRRYGEQYHAETRRYRVVARTQAFDRVGTRPVIERFQQHRIVIYEPGKCIRCGRCVRITARDSERLGLTFVGRGFNVRVAVPLGGSLEQGLQETAERCVEVCPTGALALREPRMG